MTNVDENHLTDDSDDPGRKVDKGILYYFVGNRNRWRVNRFLRSRIHKFPMIQVGIKDDKNLYKAIERDLQLLGPKYLSLVVAIDTSEGVPRKYGQGLQYGGSRNDVSAFLRIGRGVHVGL
jgi:hypothetical protein